MEVVVLTKIRYNEFFRIYYALRVTMIQYYIYKSREKRSIFLQRPTEIARVRVRKLRIADVGETTARRL